MTLSNPFNKSELKSAIQDLKQNLANSFQAIDEKTFFQKPEKGWSPAENIQHMNRVTKVLGLTYVTPKFIASFIFGETNHKSKTMNEMATIYL
ncbi:MAG TPA: hypothetical protein PLS71_24040, partial [Leptospiraceae bacterium]|nr:hypothetical protein [Leptospiraceae bacterium]